MAEFDPDKYLQGGGMPGTEVPEEDKPWAERAAETADYYRKMGRTGFNTTTFGMADRAVAAGNTLMGGAPSYAEALKERVAETERIRKENPERAFWGDLAGSAAGGLGLARAGITTAGRFATAPWWTKAGLAGAEGAALGAAQGAGQTYSGNPMDYVENAGKSAAIGGVLGLPTPAVGQVAGAAAKGVQNMWGNRYGIPGPLAAAANTDAAGVATLQNRGARAMLPDAGPAMKGTAQGAILPGPSGAMGPGQAALERNLTARDQSMPQAITREVDQTFGPATTPSVVEAGVRGRMRAIGPEYDTLLNGPNVRAIDNSALAQRLEALAINERGETQEVVRRVRGMLDIPTNPGHLDPHPRALHATREEVRGMMNDPKLNDTSRGRLQQIYRELTDEIQTKVPGIRELDSRYAELGTQAEAATVASPGARMFEKGRAAVTRPGELQDVMTEAAQPKGVNIGPSAEPVRLRQAARSELDRIVGTNKNDLLALENMLGRPQDWNAQKLGVMFGRERAERLMNVLENERVFRESFQEIVKGSKTAKTTASKEALDASSGRIPKGMTAADIVVQPLQWAKDKLLATGAANTRDRISQILATNDPQQIQALIPRLLAAEPDRNRRAEIVRNLIQSGLTSGGAGIAPGIIRR